MRKIFIFIYCLLCLISCATDVNDTQYEPIYLNKTKHNISYVWGNDYGTSDTIIIHPNDTIYLTNGVYLPPLIKEGLRWNSNSPYYDIYLIFHADSQKCLSFLGDDFLPKDMRLFSSYENIGMCDLCALRTMRIPEGMLYTITEDLYKLATPCEKENSKK